MSRSTHFIASCQRCKEPFTAEYSGGEVSSIEGYLTGHQDNALDIQLTGGYGQYIDNELELMFEGGKPSERYQATLCGSCAEGLMKWLNIDWKSIQAPWIEIDEQDRNSTER